MAELMLGAASTLVCAAALFWWVWSLRQNRKIPSPRGCLPILGHLHLLGELPHQSLSNLSKDQGPIMLVKLGSTPTVVASSPSVAKEFLENHDLEFADRPKLTAPHYILYGSRDLAWSGYGPYWRELRKICTTNLFTAKRMSESLEIRQEELSMLVSSIVQDGNCGRNVVNMNSLLSVSTMNAVTRMAFGVRLFSEEGERLVGLVHEMMSLIGSFHVGDYVPWLSWLDLTGCVPRMKKVHRQLDVVLQDIINERRRRDDGDDPGNGKTTRDLLDILLSTLSNDDSIKAIILDVISGGTDTSSITVEWALSELIKNPTCMLKLREELSKLHGDVEEADLSRLVYLKAVVKETFRLHPPVPLLIPHQSSKACKVGGFEIPRKARLLVNVWSMGRDSSVWGDSALDFKPERFIEDHGAVDVKGKDFELIPFGSGRRMCPGMMLGLCMVELTLARLVQAFRWSANDDDLSMEEAPGLVMRRKVPLTPFAVPV